MKKEIEEEVEEEGAYGEEGDQYGAYVPEFQEVACVRCGYATHKCKCISLGLDTAWCLVCNTDTGFCDQLNHPERE